MRQFLSRQFLSRQFLPLAIFCWFSLVCLVAQPKPWELSQEDLLPMIRSADLIVEGKLGTKAGDNLYKIVIAEVFQGPQKLNTVVGSIPEDKRSGIQAEGSYLFFLQKDKSGYRLLPGLAVFKSDLFISSRIRKETLKWRVERSDAVVLATVQTVQEDAQDKNLLVTAGCKTIQTGKGAVAETWNVQYVRTAKTIPPMVLLFQDINYIFFLKKSADGKSYELINPYEGAYLEKRIALEEIRQAAVIANPFDTSAGKEEKGIKCFAQAADFKQNEAGFVKVLLQNVTGTELEIYHNQIAFFARFQVLEETGKAVAPKELPQEAEPAIDNSHFLKLGAEEYIILPEIDLRQYYSLTPGRYLLYVEFSMPPAYTGQNLGKTGWYGKVISNKVELTVTE